MIFLTWFSFKIWFFFMGMVFHGWIIQGWIIVPWRQGSMIIPWLVFFLFGARVPENQVIPDRFELVRHVCEPIIESIGKDAVQGSPPPAIVVTLAIGSQNTVAIYPHCAQMVERAAHRGFGGYSRVSLETCAGWIGPPILVSVQCDAHEHAEGVEALTSVEKVNLVAQGDGDLYVDLIFRPVQADPPPVENSDHFRSFLSLDPEPGGDAGTGKAKRLVDTYNCPLPVEWLRLKAASFQAICRDPPIVQPECVVSTFYSPPERKRGAAFTAPL
jgi:hypothetical protein